MSNADDSASAKGKGLIVGVGWPDGLPMKKKRKRKRKSGRNAARRDQLLKEDPHCRYCGCLLTKKSATLDHVKPRSKGGTIFDTVLACQPCNHEKGRSLVGLAFKPKKLDGRD